MKYQFRRHRVATLLTQPRNSVSLRWMMNRSLFLRSRSSARKEPLGPPVPNLMNPEQSLRTQQHHADQKQRVDNQSILIEITERLGQNGEDNSREHYARDRAAPAEHRHQ